MAHFLGLRFPRQANPTAMKIWGFGADACINQHLRGFDIRCLDGHAVSDRADTREHFAADLPCIMPAAPGVGQLGSGQFGADGIDGFAAHACQSADARGRTQDLARFVSRAMPSSMNPMTCIIICCITC